MNEKGWMSIASSIRSAIRRGDLQPGARIASETEMARQWNVSPMTIQRALMELQREGWVIRRRRVGTVVADHSRRPMTRIGLIFSNYVHLPQSAYFIGIEEGVGADTRLVPLTTNHSASEEAKCLEAVAADCDAVICYPTGAQENTPLLKRIAARMPLMFIDCMPEDVVADVAMTDNFGSIQMGLQHLRSLGHTRIAYFMGISHRISSVRERYAGYRQFMRHDPGCSDPDRWVRSLPNALPRDLLYENVEATLIDLLSGPEPITAIACQQDVQLELLLEVCFRLNISIPDELAVLSFTNAAAGQALLGSVHRLVQRATELGNMAARRVLLRLNSPDLSPQSMCLLTDLYPANTYSPSAAAREFRAGRDRSQ